MNTNEPAEKSNKQPGPRQSIVRVIAVILGAVLIAFPLHSIFCSVLNLPSLPFRWIVLAIIAIVVLVRWRSWAKKSPAPSLSSLHQPGPRRRALFGGIALACGAAQLCCFSACYFFAHGRVANVGIGLFVIGFLLTFPALGCALVGIGRREQPKWPAAAGGLIGASPVVIAIMAGIYINALQPMIERVSRASPNQSPAKAASANPPIATGTSPMTPADAPASSSGSPANRWLSDDRAQWCAEAQAAVESWLRSGTNNLFTPEYGKL